MSGRAYKPAQSRDLGMYTHNYPDPFVHGADTSTLDSLDN